MPISRDLLKDTREGYSASKNDLKNALKVEPPMRDIIPEATMIEGCTMMHRVQHWPKGGKV